MEKILVVDDSTVSRMLIRQLIEQLSEQDVDIVEADSGEAALEIAAQNNAFDRAILDFNMPGINGIELAEQIRTSLNISKSALLTANIQESTQEKAAQVGLTFLCKPITEKVIKAFLNL